jgi:hypothetical protein
MIRQRLLDLAYYCHNMHGQRLLSPPLICWLLLALTCCDMVSTRDHSLVDKV